MKVCPRCCLAPIFLALYFVTPGRVDAQAPTVENMIRLRVEQARQQPTVGVRGARLLQPEPVARFFEARAFAPAWRVPSGAEQMLAAIRNIDQDGLNPAHYHLAVITTALDAYAKTPSTDVAADLQVLVADAAAALIDHVRYGRVRPASLDKRWNVDPRVGAPPLDIALEDLARASLLNVGLDVGLESKKPTHFIYTGLKQALARMRAVATAGGWPAVKAGTTAIKPAATDPRVAMVRKRLRVTGELAGATSVDDPVYGPDLESAVKDFQAHHRLTDDGVIGKATIEAMNVSAEARVQQLRVNLERARWVVGGLSDTFVLVNLPAFKTYVIRDRKNVWEARTQIGRAARQTPTFRADMKYLVLNPDWTVPPTILAQDVLGGMRKGENTIARKRLTILDQQGRTVDPTSIDWQTATPGNFRYTLRQPPGPDNALGRVKFIFPNQYSIFLHDTPSQELFASDQRTFSSGCIRVEQPLDLAAVLLDGHENWTPARIQEVVASKQSHTVFLSAPLPVLIVYWTVSVGASGELRFANDVYTLDPAVLRALNPQ